MGVPQKWEELKISPEGIFGEQENYTEVYV